MSLVHPSTPVLHQLDLANDWLCLYSDLLEAGYDTLKERLHTDGLSETEAQRLTDCCWSNLTDRLYVVIEPTLMAHYLLAEPDLIGDAPADKWLAFATLLKDDTVKDYFEQHYPLLGQRIKQETAQWVVHCHKLVKRFFADSNVLARTLYGTANALRLSSIETNLGDKHQGASVSIVTLEDGKKMVYIPRERPLHPHFNALCTWLDKALRVGLRQPLLVEGSGYCWMEFIPHTSCSKEEQVDQFYKRLGVYLAILYTLEATDFHYENLIACGEYPVLIDVETFFHPFMPFEHGDSRHTLYNSVLKTGLLPTGFTHDGHQRADLSGLSNPAGHQGFAPTLQFQLSRSGLIKGIRQANKLAGGSNNPLLNGSTVSFSVSHAQALKEGFTEAYHFLLTNKGAYLEQVQAFKNDAIRLLFRPTVAYAHLLKEGLHPDYLKQSEQADRLLDNLDLVADDYPECVAFLEAEKSDLKQRNVPYFHATADSLDVWHNGQLLAEGFFHQSGYRTAVEKISHLSQADLDRQCWIIDMSLGTLGIKPANSLQRQTTDTVSVGESHDALTDEPSATDTWLDKAIMLADGIMETMHEEKDAAAWMVYRPSNLDASHYVLTPASYDLYSGMPGELLFFSYLGQLSGKSRYTDLAYKAWLELSRRLEHETCLRNLGLFGGWGGLVYMCALLYKQKRDSRWLEESFRLLDKTKPCAWAVKEKSHGLVNGSAGFMLACLAMYKVSKENRFLQVAEKMGGLLLRAAMQTEKHIRWSGHSKQPLAGLSHGSSGFALAFGRLYHATGTKRYKEVVKKILNYEQYLFDPVRQNWPDLRDFILEQEGGQPAFPTAWSHGAPGIGLTRLELLKCGVRCQAVQNDLDIALNTCMQEGFNDGYSLCFGRFGNLELLLNHADFTGDPVSKSTCLTLADKQLKEGLTQQFLFQGGGLRSPGLMNGVTGIAYQCLRLHDSTVVPSILTAAV
ncbi:MAG: type 2 lantipeptide synthetase LanM [Bacteroidales bacterium]|nr:type 2 lantipeptide synthetase LanM [Bacteroidales bacterium]